MSPLSAVSVVLGLVATAAAAISNVQAPSSPAANQNVTINWSADSSDTTPVTLALYSSDTNVTYPGGLAIANDVNPQDKSITVTFPQVNPGSYHVSFISASDTSDVLASSSAFTVGGANDAAAASTTTTTTATVSASGSGSGAASSTATSPASRTASSLSSQASAISASASSALSSISAISASASSALSSISAGASSALASLSSGASSASRASSSSSGSASTGAAAPVRLLGPGVAAALVASLAGVAAGAFAL